MIIINKSFCNKNNTKTPSCYAEVFAALVINDYLFSDEIKLKLGDGEKLPDIYTEDKDIGFEVTIEESNGNWKKIDALKKNVMCSMPCFHKSNWLAKSVVELIKKKQNKYNKGNYSRVQHCCLVLCSFFSCSGIEIIKNSVCQAYKEIKEDVKFYKIYLLTMNGLYEIHSHIPAIVYEFNSNEFESLIQRQRDIIAKYNNIR